MSRALELAALGARSTHPNPRVGCVILRDGETVGEGWHVYAGQPHAEVLALRAAGTRTRGAEVFVSLEPCAHFGRTPPCADALIEAGVARVHIAMVDPDSRTAGRSIERLRAAGIDVRVGLGAEAAIELNRGFNSRVSRHRPWLSLKIGASLDGRTAAANGESRWITGPAARADVHRLRAEAGAVLVGADTVRADDPLLTVRDAPPLPDGATASSHPPDRIVLDPRGRVPASARVWHADGARRFHVIGASAGEQADEGTPPEHAGVMLLRPNCDAAGRPEFPALLAALAAQEINEVLVEAGPHLAGALLVAGVVDELLIYQAPSLLGSAAQAMAELPGVGTLAQRISFRYVDATPIGDDLRLRLRPVVA